MHITTTNVQHEDVSATTSSGGDSTSPLILSIPLVPRHIQYHRRLQELTTQQRREHSTRYPRRRRLLGRNNNKLSSSSSTSSTSMLISAGLFQGYGTHYADVYCGTPHPQRLTLIVDTGSATTAFPCSTCTPRNCGRLDRYHSDGLFQETQSDTFHKFTCEDCYLGECSSSTDDPSKQQQCTFGVQYQEGSNWTAYEAQDRCFIGLPGNGRQQEIMNEQSTGNTKETLSSSSSEESFHLRFGCQFQITGSFRTQLEDGIMGFNLGRPAIWNQLYLQNKIASRSFSLCFTRPRLSKRSGTPAGALTFGGTDTRLHNVPMVYTSVSTTQDSSTDAGGANFFGVRLQKVYLYQPEHGTRNQNNRNKNLKQYMPLEISEEYLNDGNVIIDSGTTDSYFVHQ